MAVYFVYRCHYGAPSEKHVRTFEYDTVLDWARAIFKQFPDRKDAFKYAEEVLGGLDVYSFGSMFTADEETGARSAPRTMADVKGWFQAMYDQGEAHGPHHIQILTDDDEIEMAVYVFDDHYRKKKPGKTDFLLLDGWELPAGESTEAPPKLPRTDLIEPGGGGEGTLYAVSLFADDSSNLSDKNECDRGCRITGLRVPDLARYLLAHPENDHHDVALRAVRANLLALLDKPTRAEAGFLAAIRKHPTDLTTWGAYSDWLQDRDLPPAGLHLLDRALRAEAFGGARANRNPAFDRVKVAPHVAQACKHEGRWPDQPMLWFTPSDTFTQFMFFDDQWAAAHPTLATGVLTFASRWDVLT
jgi:uncharacterized protein (TIGR02996 family)